MPKYSVDRTRTDTDNTDEPNAESPATPAEPAPPTPDTDDSDAAADADNASNDNAANNNDDDGGSVIDDAAGHASASFYESLIREKVSGVTSVDLVTPSNDDARLEVTTKTALGKATLKRLLTEDADDGGLNIPLLVLVSTES